MSRRRLDAILTSRGLFGSREQARAAILAGDVTVAGVVLTKAGAQVEEAADIEVRERPRFVSRGGLKLEGALETFGLEVTGARAVDVGASTGGFTDALLQRGASEVVAVDVGYGQLAWSLRTDSRVRLFERTNIRHADPHELGAPFDLVVADLSFISLNLVLDRLLELCGEEGQLLLLVKPQFEAGKGRVGKKGVVRDPDIHADVLRATIESLKDRGCGVLGLVHSPITGPEGNIEFWVWAAPGAPTSPEIDVEAVVGEAHARLRG